MHHGLDRRTALLLGGAAIAGGALPAGAALEPTLGVLVFDTRSADALRIARAAEGYRLMALVGDPVRFWRASLGEHRGPVRGLTRWSDYLILLGLAEEQGLRLTRQNRIEATTGPMVVDWHARQGSGSSGARWG